jgi:hypothetical protein
LPAAFAAYVFWSVSAFLLPTKFGIRSIPEKNLRNDSSATPPVGNCSYYKYNFSAGGIHFFPCQFSILGVQYLYYETKGGNE